MKLKLVDIKDPVLRKKAKSVKKFDKKLVSLVAEMQKLLKVQSDPEGIGLAAPQIGKSLRLFIIDNEGVEKVIINPKVVSIKKAKASKNKKKKEILEGCLSLPHFYGPITRSREITISFQDVEGKKQKHKFIGFLAQIVEHEIDHLNGKLFVDRVFEQKVSLYKFKGDEWEEVEL